VNGPRLAPGHLGLRQRVYLLMAVGIFFPVALMAGLGFYWLRALDERLLGGRVSAASTVAAHYDQELTGDLEILQRLASGMGPRLVKGSPADEAQAVQTAFSHFRHREAVYILDADRKVVAEAPHGRAYAAPRVAMGLVDEVLRTGLPRLSGLVTDAQGSVVNELVPVRDYSGAVVGVAGGTFDPMHRDFDHMLRMLKRGQTGVADLVDSNGSILASTEARRVGGRTGCQGALAPLLAERRADWMRLPHGCPLEGEAKGAELSLVTFAPLSSAPWGVVVHQTASEALPTEGGVPWILVTGLLAAQLVLAGVFAWGAARSVTQPLAVLTQEAERIASGRLDWPIPPLGEDEVGHLGWSLDRMRQSIKALVERVERANEELEVRVAERTRSLDDANAELRVREAARGEMLRKVITAQEDERKRVARELHDETTQDLAVLLMRIDRASEAIRSGGSPGLDEVKALATRCLEDVHRLILDLRPSVLDDLGLLSAIRWYAERALTSRGVSVRCEFGELGRLPPELETALFRMCQEAMSNVARHAQASRVLIQVSIEGHEIHVDIEDDGRGFDAEAVAKREGRRPFGLVGIRERAELVDGHARIESTPGAGTRVEVRIPLPVEVA
jgi:signal transduction histidine kinase